MKVNTLFKCWLNIFYNYMFEFRGFHHWRYSSPSYILYNYISSLDSRAMIVTNFKNENYIPIGFDIRFLSDRLCILYWYDFYVCNLGVYWLFIKARKNLTNKIQYKTSRVFSFIIRLRKTHGIGNYFSRWRSKLWEIGLRSLWP